MNIKQLRPGQSGRVVGIEGNGPVRQRLLDMGIMPNVIIKVERVSVSGDPIWIQFQGAHLSLRRLEAESVMVRGN